MKKNIFNDIKIKIAEKKDLSSKEKRILMGLTFRAESGLKDVWKDIYIPYHRSFYDVEEHKVFIAFFKETIVGWSICYRERGSTEHYAMIYVRRSHRRMKVGTRIMKEVKNYCKSKRKKLFVFNEQPEFFSYCEIPKDRQVSY